MDTAAALQKQIQQSPEFADLKAAYEVMKQDGKSYDLFKDFQEVQLEVQKQQMQGVEPDQAKVKQAHDLAEQMQQNQIITDLMQKEQGVNQLLNRINQVVTAPIADLYRN